MATYDSPAFLIFFSVFWYLFLAAFLYLIDYATACFRRWSVFTVLVPLLVLHHGVSVPFVVNAAYEAQGVDQGSYFAVWLAMLVSMYAFMLLGAAIVGRPHPRSEQLDYRVNAGFGSADMAPVMIVLSLAIVGVLFQLVTAPRFFSMSDLFSAEVSAEAYREQRQEFAVSTSGVTGIANYLTSVALTSVIPITLFVGYMARGGSRKYLFIFWGLLFLSVVRALFTGHKATLLITLISLFGVQLFIRHGGRVRLSRAQMAVGILIAFVVVPFMFYLQYADYISTYSEALEATAYRMLVEPNRALQLYAYFYPDLEPHLLGRTSRVIAGIFGDGEQFIPPHTFLALAWGVIDVTWNVVFVGDAWADFGMAGVAVESLVVGAMLKGIDEWFWTYSGRGWLEIAVFFAEIFAVVRLAFAGLGTVLVGFGIIPSLLLWLVAVSIRSRRRQFSR